MDFTAGLMPLETALTQMLARITHCMRLKRCRLCAVLAVLPRAILSLRLTCRGLITPRWTVTRCAWRISRRVTPAGGG